MSRARWSAKRAARTLFHKTGRWRMCEEEWLAGYAEHLTHAYLAGVKAASQLGPPSCSYPARQSDIEAFARGEKKRLSAEPKDPARG